MGIAASGMPRERGEGAVARRLPSARRVMHDTNAFVPPVLCAFSWFAGAPDWLQGAVPGWARYRCQSCRPSAMVGGPGERRRGSATAGRLQRIDAAPDGFRTGRTRRRGRGEGVGFDQGVVGSTGLANRQRVHVNEDAEPVHRSRSAVRGRSPLAGLHRPEPGSAFLGLWVAERGGKTGQALESPRLGATKARGANNDGRRARDRKLFQAQSIILRLMQ